MRVLWSIGLLSAAIIAFQLALMQQLSIVQWYHFAYMVISVALLGFGTAGTVLSIFRKRLLAHLSTWLYWLMMGAGISMALVTIIAQAPAIRFDSYLLFTDIKQAGLLLLTYLLFFIPFFLGALAIGLLFIPHADRIGKIYFANLLGSGIGGILALAGVDMLTPRQLTTAMAILPVLAAWLIAPPRFVIALAAIAIIGLTWLYPSPLVLSQYKDLSKTLLLPGAKITLEKNSPYGLIQTLTSPALRYAPGLSLTATRTGAVKEAAFVNGDWFGVVIQPDTSFILNYTTFALPYVIAQRQDVLVLRAGTGVDILHARSRGAAHITAVEPNAAMLSLLKNEWGANISTHALEPRTFLSTGNEEYDLITLPITGSFGGSAGLYALQEQFVLTREAFLEMWIRLHHDGAISVSAWMDYPLRNPLKLLATITDMLYNAGIEDPRQHIAAIRSWGTITFTVTRTPLQGKEIARIRQFCNDMQFDPAILPGLKPAERAQYNQFEDTLFFHYIDRILSPDRNSFYKEYDFNIRPATDNQPYFSQFIKLSRLQKLAAFSGNRSLPFFELGYLLVVATFVQITILSFILIIVPLFRKGWKSAALPGILVYFSGIGIGYMFVEIVLIQRFILYFGTPVYAASAVITSLLTFSGIGSYISPYFKAAQKRLLPVIGCIVGLLLLYAFLLTPLLQYTMHLALPFKAVVVLLLIAPLAFLMGIPFPAGLSYVAQTEAAAVPWAWGVNGCLSVISTGLASIIAVELGFTWVMLLAAAAYSLVSLPLLFTSGQPASRSGQISKGRNVHRGHT
jgi:hypothetical protein